MKVAALPLKKPANLCVNQNSHARCRLWLVHDAHRLEVGAGDLGLRVGLVFVNDRIKLAASRIFDPQKPGFLLKKTVAVLNRPVA